MGWDAGKTVVHPLFCYRFQCNECPYVKPDPLTLKENTEVFGRRIMTEQAPKPTQ